MFSKLITFIKDHKDDKVMKFIRVIGVILLIPLLVAVIAGILLNVFQDHTQASKNQETWIEIEKFFSEYGSASKSAFNSGDYNEISSFITGNEEGTYGGDMVDFTEAQPGNHVHKKLIFHPNSVKKETDSTYIVIVDERYIYDDLKEKECKNLQYTNREYTLKKMKNNELKIESMDKSNESSFSRACKE